MKKEAARIVRSGLPIRRREERGRRPRERPPEPSVYRNLDSWEPPAREKDRKPGPESHLGRPRIPRDKRRSVPFSFKMSPEEFAMFDAHVEKLGCSGAAFVREAIFTAMGKAPPERPTSARRRASTKKRP